MPDDDRFIRDHFPGWKSAYDHLKKDLPSGQTVIDDLPDPDQKVIANDRVPDTLKKATKTALKETIEILGKPDLETAGREVREIARQLTEDSPDEIDLCAGTQSAGMDALLKRAKSVVIAATDPHELLAASGDDLARMVGEEFARGVSRRYGIDRIAPFDQGADALDALDLLEAFDLTFGGVFLRELLDDLLSD